MTFLLLINEQICTHIWLLQNRAWVTISWPFFLAFFAAHLPSPWPLRSASLPSGITRLSIRSIQFVWHLKIILQAHCRPLLPRFVDWSYNVLGSMKSILIWRCECVTFSRQRASQCFIATDQVWACAAYLLCIVVILESSISEEADWASLYCCRYWHGSWGIHCTIRRHQKHCPSSHLQSLWNEGSSSPRSHRRKASCRRRLWMTKLWWRSWRRKMRRRRLPRRLSRRGLRLTELAIYPKLRYLNIHSITNEPILRTHSRFSLLRSRRKQVLYCCPTA